jgi:hypothetical protein
LPPWWWYHKSEKSSDAPARAGGCHGIFYSSAIIEDSLTKESDFVKKNAGGRGWTVSHSAHNLNHRHHEENLFLTRRFIIIWGSCRLLSLFIHSILRSSMLSCLFQTKKAISSIGEIPQEPDGTIKGEESDEAITKVPRSFMDIVGITGIASSAATLFLTEGHVVTIASFCTMGLAPYAALQKRQLRKLGGMRGLQNELRENVNFLCQQNNILYHSINKLGVQVHK